MGPAIDHLLLAVGDLQAAAARLEGSHGLTALEGGRHPGAGTANMIVPLGPAYLELIAVVDPSEAAANPLSRRVSGALDRGSTFATWAVRVDDIDALRARLDRDGVATNEPRPGSRRRPDGVLLEWRALHLGDGLEPAIPFFIEWRLPDGEHPGSKAVQHPAGRVALKGVRLTAPDPARLEVRLRGLFGEGIPLTVTPGEREELAAAILDVNGEERELTRL
jgi:hypothetical protein